MPREELDKEMLFVKKSYKKLLVAGLAALTLYSGVSVMQQSVSEAKVKFDTFDFEAHRGGRDARPENTLYAYAYAMELGATTIECDMQLTKDGHIVMSHNPVLNHDITRDENGNYIESGKYDIRTMTLDELKKFDVGVMDPNCGEYYELHGRTQVGHNAEIPTLDELFELVESYGNKDVYFNIETKSYPDPADPESVNSPDPKKFVKAFNKVVKKYNMEDRVVLQSFDWRTLIEMKKVNPNISTSALWQASSSWEEYGDAKSPWLGGVDLKDFGGDPVKAAKSIDADVISPYFKDIDKADVDEAHELGMLVVPWTVNSESDINAMIDMGVDGIISDKPWLLKKVLEERNIKLHTPTVKMNSPYHTGTAHHDVETITPTDGRDAAY